VFERILWQALHLLIAICCCTVSVGFAKDSISAPVILQLTKQLRADVSEMRECTPKNGLLFDARALDLNGDAQPEYVLTSASECECGKANCSTWIYRQDPSGFKLLLATQGFQLSRANTSHHGYQDIDITAQNNAATVDHLHYVFNGSAYQPTDVTMENLATHEKKLIFRQVKFSAGRSSASLIGSAEPGFGDSWIVGAKKGQIMHLKLTSLKPSSAMLSMMGPKKSGEHLVVDQVKKWSGALPENGNYTILIDSATEARSTYTLDIEIESIKK
jgi:hypothetical protein